MSDPIQDIARQLGITTFGDGLLTKIRETIDLLQSEANNLMQYKEVAAELEAELAAFKAKAVIPEKARDALAWRCLWIAYVWNDHNFLSAYKYAREEAESHGITGFDEANEWLEAQQQSDDELSCDYCGALTEAPWHGSGEMHGKENRHIHACDNCRDLLPKCAAPARQLATLKAKMSGVDERVAFEAAYLKANYPRVAAGELSAPPIFGRVGSMKFHWQAEGDYECSDIQKCWVIWQARAALSAPNHSGQVRELSGGR